MNYAEGKLSLDSCHNVIKQNSDVFKVVSEYLINLVRKKPSSVPNKIIVLTFTPQNLGIIVTSLKHENIKLKNINLYLLFTR